MQSLSSVPFQPAHFFFCLLPPSLSTALPPSVGWLSLSWTNKGLGGGCSCKRIRGVSCWCAIIHASLVAHRDYQTVWLVVMCRFEGDLLLCNIKTNTSSYKSKAAVSGLWNWWKFLSAVEDKLFCPLVSKWRHHKLPTSTFSSLICCLLVWLGGTFCLSLMVISFL